MKLGIIGFGRRLSGLLPHFRRHAPDLGICGIVDSNVSFARERLPEDLRGEVRFFPTLAELIRETAPDAIAIGTRCDSHAAHAMEAAPYGLPIFLEKPVATTLEQANSLAEAFRRHPSPVLVSFPLRVSALCRQAAARLRQGAVGRIDHLMAVNYVSYGDVYFNTWFRDYSVTGGLFLQKATHDFDYLSYLTGSAITRVGAMASQGRIYRDSSTATQDPTPDALYLDDIGTPESGMNEDSSSALLEFSCGAKGVYTQVFYSRRRPRRGVAVSGFRGLLEFDWYDNAIKVTRHREAIDETISVQGDDCHFGGDAELAENFIAMIRDGAPSLAPLETGLASVYACLAARSSSATGQFLNVQQMR